MYVCSVVHAVACMYVECGLYFLLKVSWFYFCNLRVPNGSVEIIMYSSHEMQGITKRNQFFFILVVGNIFCEHVTMLKVAIRIFFFV